MDIINQTNLEMEKKNKQISSKWCSTVHSVVACDCCFVWFVCICNELGIGQRWLSSDVTGRGRSGSHKEQQTHSGDGISVFND